MSQNKFIDVLDRSFGDIADWSINNRLWVVVFAVLMLALGGYFLTKVRFDGSMEGFFDKNDSAYGDYKNYLDEFLSDEITYILYRAPGAEHGPFNIDVMRTIGKLTETLEDEVPFAREATSLTNVEFMFAEEDLLIVDELMINFPENQEQLLDIKTRVMSKPAYVDYLINEAGDYAAIYLEMNRASPDPLEEMMYDPEKGEALDNLYPQVSDIKVREILDRPEFANSGIEFFLTGDVPMNSAYNVEYSKDSGNISLYTVGLIALISFLLLRTSLVGLLAPLTVVVLSIVMMMGVIGMMGWSVGLFITMAPSLICAIGVAQTVHILLEYQRSLSQQGDKSTAVREAIKKVGAPCMLAALTTAAAFCVMSVSDLKALAEFGIYSAVGVAFTFILSITLLVIFLASGKKSAAQIDSPAAAQQTGDGGLDSVNPLVRRIVEGAIILNQRHPKAILFTFAAVFLWAFVGLSKLSVDFNFMHEFKPHVQWRQDTELADRVMGGIMSVAYVIDTKTEDGVKDVEFLKALDKMQEFASSLPLVKKTFSIVDFVKDLNRTFNNDDPAYYTVPDDQQLVSQYLLVYEISGGDELHELVAPDFSSTVLELRVVMTEASKLRDIVERIDAYVAANPLPNAELKVTGIGLLWVIIADYISKTQMLSYSLVFVFIALVMCIAFGSIKVGLLSMIPNLTPVIITLGMMGWLGINLDWIKLLLATIAIGIAVDDTIHLVTRFRSRFYQLGNYAEASTASLRDVGPALVITTFILIGSFLAYMITDLAVLRDFGILLGITIGTALIADLLLMPVILMTVKPLGKEFSVSDREREFPIATETA